MDAFLCSYWDEVGCGDATDCNIRYAVKFAAKVLKYPERGIPLQRIDAHSLRSGRVCALALEGFKDRNDENGLVGPKITSIHGVYPTTAVNIFSWNVNRNEQRRQIHQYGRGSIERDTCGG
eukprot:CAMPEP_0201878722 /NCGR_PEP_ID=MMETSP0902-20130614/9813_1 /ASSEMBLY_ACC=CAM_ASM_000551 /TAXON_ID=420261 /ORGANISM="Thalassiosira antarctica, Strain CCMP982" /LENGTH=120 /DNA_ID=CAMNT_0048406409 /DNA_START=201 /DNA_END=563 /DNA_ORIENTATION=+